MIIDFIYKISKETNKLLYIKPLNLKTKNEVILQIW
jgi:hypothetical protein